MKLKEKRRRDAREIGQEREVKYRKIGKEIYRKLGSMRRLDNRRGTTNKTK